MTAEPTGADIARQALARARANSKDKPIEGPPVKRKRPPKRNPHGREPISLIGAVRLVLEDAGWDLNVGGADVVAAWPTIAPELARAVAAVHFDPNTGTLHLRPASPAYAAQLRLFDRQLVARINEKTGGRPAVRALRILAPGRGRSSVSTTDEPAPAPTPLPEPEPEREYMPPEVAHFLERLFSTNDERRAAERAAADRARADALRFGRRHAPTIREPEAGGAWETVRESLLTWNGDTADQEDQHAVNARRQAAALQRRRADRAAFPSA